MTSSDAKRKKAEITRQRILDAALPLMLDGGYEKMTMRAIAKKAGLSPGAAYYYFETKEHIINAFYERSLVQHEAACRTILEEEKNFAKRLKLCVQAQIEISRPYHEISAALFKVAADPNHPLSPFSEPSRPLRERSMRIFAEIYRGSRSRVPKPLDAFLPGLLWLYHMGIILFWVYDKTPGQKKTDRFIERTVPLLINLIRLAKVPGFSRALKATLQLLDDFSFLKLPEAEKLSDKK
ncbi:TetR/AcrR family transcriptional regulator [Acanthopleuribacter pedis]|uniref:TetR family transcriptional regulator n=1 Tax=Acanthopleuribacter pedis TaxID=442870 RepID=A0A8J7Q2T5_9BACT|nr:TetR family transcriptional regulator [Acanthopleuribacter pedis]MBO1318210.1 TetR family transcriptional regulator [Acanthopleuribacter pedis]